MNSLKRYHILSSQKKKQKSKSRSTGRRKGLSLLLHIPKDPDMIILQGAVVVVMIPDLHHEADLHHVVVPHRVAPPGVVALPGVAVLPIINLHIRVEVSQHTGAVGLVATETVTDTEIIHHHLRAEILVITIHRCVQVEVTGRHIQGAWNPRQLTTMTDMQQHPLHRHTAMTGAHHPHLMDMHLLPKEGEGVVDIMAVGMAVMEVEAVTEVGLLLHLHHIIIPKGGTEQLETVFC